jgi:hypothetical protein
VTWIARRSPVGPDATGLAGDAEQLRRLGERDVAFGHLGHEAAAHLVGEADPPGRVRGHLLAGEEALLEPAADRRRGDVELGGRLVDRDDVAGRVRRRAAGMVQPESSRFWGERFSSSLRSCSCSSRTAP